jgi:hypothetical protein
MKIVSDLVWLTGTSVNESPGDSVEMGPARSPKRWLNAAELMR